MYCEAAMASGQTSIQALSLTLDLTGDFRHRPPFLATPLNETHWMWRQFISVYNCNHCITDSRFYNKQRSYIIELQKYEFSIIIITTILLTVKLLLISTISLIHFRDTFISPKSCEKLPLKYLIIQWQSVWFQELCKSGVNMEYSSSDILLLFVAQSITFRAGIR